MPRVTGRYNLYGAVVNVTLTTGCEKAVLAVFSTRMGILTIRARTGLASRFRIRTKL
jgi:hypothetical protein